MSYRKKILLLIALTTLTRLVLSGTTELGNVEVYYWSWSVKPQWNYVDHPPLVAWMIWLTTFGQTWVTEVSVRAGSVVAAALSTWIIYQTGILIKDERTGWFSAILYNCCVYSSMAIGVYVLPDSIQIVFWLASLFVLLKIITTPIDNSRVLYYWLLFGLLSGLCIMSKVHGAFIWFGAILYMLLNDRDRFFHWHILAALVVTVAVVSPVFIWNMQHNWYTWNFQSTRFNVSSHSADLLQFGKQLIQVVFTIGPITFFLAWRSIILFLKKQQNSSVPIQTLLYCNLPLIIFMLLVSIFRETYAHWPGPGYSALLILPALTFSAANYKSQKKLPAIFRWAIGYSLGVAVLQIVFINYFPGTTSIYKEGQEIGKDDATVDMVGWQDFGKYFANIYKSDFRIHKMQLNSPILSNTWTPASAIDFYVARTAKTRLLGAGSLDSLHQYYFINQYRQPLLKGGDAYYIVPSNYFNLKTINRITDHFKQAETTNSFPIYRSGILCKEFFIIRLMDYDGIPFDGL